ncbi:hypothetical protein HMPREF9136_2080 [Prevotella dentalis DSM 3688]|uniref:Uncharacterized protein n=1 Tax=Prevotella dentalis (strain ATCC 49559 / DSM 3688 / JCM 13448 / NCTC 12043 / ES 2772) TaxID=908937 RepID=F9D5F2_PREDD|nr:hypothetical protein HMPREF9136_2080 [Prevotella dentalis DSM 3688]
MDIQVTIEARALGFTVRRGPTIKLQMKVSIIKGQDSCESCPF